MARTPSSRASLLLALLAGGGAAQHQESAKSIPVPSIAAATLSSTGALARCSVLTNARKTMRERMPGIAT